MSKDLANICRRLFADSGVVGSMKSCLNAPHGGGFLAAVSDEKLTYGMVVPYEGQSAAEKAERIRQLTAALDAGDDFLELLAKNNHDVQACDRANALIDAFEGSYSGRLVIVQAQSRYEGSDEVKGETGYDASIIARWPKPTSLWMLNAFKEQADPVLIDVQQLSLSVASVVALEQPGDRQEGDAMRQIVQRAGLALVREEADKQIRDIYNKESGVYDSQARQLTMDADFF